MGRERPETVLPLAQRADLHAHGGSHSSRLHSGQMRLVEVRVRAKKFVSYYVTQGDPFITGAQQQYRSSQRDNRELLPRNPPLDFQLLVFTRTFILSGTTSLRCAQTRGPPAPVASKKRLLSETILSEIWIFEINVWNREQTHFHLDPFTRPQLSLLDIARTYYPHLPQQFFPRPQKRIYLSLSPLIP